MNRNRFRLLGGRICVGLLSALFFSGLAGAPSARSAETCSGGVSEFELLDPGDEDSGIGGTGITSPSPNKPPAQVQAERSGDENDSGLGGTGRAPHTNGDSDSGIGGTGLYGTVTRTDRLCVGGTEFAVPSSLLLESSAATAGGNRALALGQIAFVHALRSEDGWVAVRIVIDGEYAGQIEQVSPDGRNLVVSGHPVRLRSDAHRDPELAQAALRKGQWIRIHGLADGERIVASRIETGRPGERLRLGRGEEFVDTGAARWIKETPGLAYVSVEGFVRRGAGGLSVGGLTVAPRDPAVSAATDGLRPGALVRVGGRVGANKTLRMLPPPTWARPPRDAATPNGGRETAAPEGGAAPTPSGRPTESKGGATPPKRPEGRRVKPEIDRGPSRPLIRPIPQRPDRPTAPDIQRR